MLHRAVLNYFDGGDRKKRIVEKYGEISNWDVSKVTNTRMLHLFKKIRAVVADHAPWYQIEIAKELGWKDDLKPVAVFGSKAWLDNPYNSEAAYDRDQWKIFEEKKSQLENYDLKFDSNLSGFIENHVEFEQRRYREASFHVKAKLCGLTFSTTWQGEPVLESRPIERWNFWGNNGISGISATLRYSGELYYRTVTWGS